VSEDTRVYRVHHHYGYDYYPVATSIISYDNTSSYAPIVNISNGTDVIARYPLRVVNSIIICEEEAVIDPGSPDHA